MTRQLIAIDSTPEEGTGEVCKKAMEFARAEGLSAEVVKADDGKNAIVLVTESGTISEDAVFFVSQLSTEDPGHYSFWRETGANPFAATVKDQRLFGLGSTTGKADFACKVFALKAAIQRRSGDQICVVGVFGDPTMTEGSELLVKHLRFKPKKVVFGAATGLKILNGTHRAISMNIEIPFSSAERDIRMQLEEQEGLITQCRYFKSRLVNGVYENALTRVLEYLTQLPAETLVVKIDGGSGAFRNPTEAVLEISLESMVPGGNTSEKKTLARLQAVSSELKRIETELMALPSESQNPKVNIGRIETTPWGFTVQVSVLCASDLDKTKLVEWHGRLREQLESVGGQLKVDGINRSFQVKEKSELLNSIEFQFKRLNRKLDFEKNWISRGMIFLGQTAEDLVGLGPGEAAGSSLAGESVRLDELAGALELYTEIGSRGGH